ncbi:uncharacterized protein LOC122820571 [Gambusia affinis]|uniref:uncharacterized protein LOC122820571 n=1 Tax=Gambusia affinis TaxID=33528 RepID=UPI001CDB7C23|nr:uncharacterized protein LOC122820571 [Gambusia affinis]
MSYSEARLLRARQLVLPPISNRTLQHPSFLPLYMPTSFYHTFQGDAHPGYPMSPVELFYTDPTLPCGRRIYNSLSRKMVFDCSQLNTPPPVMSACVAPASCPDPFRAGPHPTNNLGSPSWRLQGVHPPQVQPRFVVIQLTQQEDQVITNLLKLHHQEAPQSKERVAAAQADFPGALKSNPRDFSTGSREGANKVFCIDASEERQKWSDAEYEAANTLLSSFQQVEDLIGNTAMPPDHLQSQTSQTELECQTFPPSVTCYSSQKGSCLKENGDVGSQEDMTSCPTGFDSKLEQEKVEGRSEERMLTDLEGDAVEVLLSLREATTFDATQ